MSAARIFRKALPAAALLAILLLTACPPPWLDSSLSPPIVSKPIYNCAQTIAFSGAEGNSKIAVYVNGTQVIQAPVWLGWGEIALPSALHTGDVVSAAQIVGNWISEKSRDPVTVSAVTAAVAPGGKLPVPTILPPLYECQQIVRVNGVTQGATVTLRRDADSSSTWGVATPYTIERVAVPTLKVGEGYDAMQSLCRDPAFKSDWSSPRSNVVGRPPSLPPPVIGKPLVGGSDALLLTGLVPGALVQIFAGTGPGAVAVGGGAALDTETVYKISPPLDSSKTYSPFQALCDLRSPADGSVTPDKDPPAPTVQPACQDGKYVTVCGTAVLSTVRVTMDGAKIADGAGNGGCVTLGLGNSNVLQAGKHVTAVQELSGRTSPPSPTVLVASSAAPSYNPALWNNPAHQSQNNCYNYSTDIMTDTFAQPGRAHGLSEPFTCADDGNGAMADGLVPASEKRCPRCSHLVALVISPGDSGCRADYHWYRLDDNGRWSNKSGDAPASDRDASNNPITNPETANRKFVGPDYCLDYSIFCGYYCVDKSVVVIQ